MIYQLIDEMAGRGKAVLLVSSYLPELLGVCDRIAVMCRGRLGVARPVAAQDERIQPPVGRASPRGRGWFSARGDARATSRKELKGNHPHCSTA